MNRLLLYAIGLLSIAVSLARADVPDYARDIAPILNKYCVGCHEGDDPEGGLNLISYRGLLEGGENGAALDAHEPTTSLMLARITGRIEPIMPPEEEPRPSESELAQLIQWVSAGAPGPKAEPALRELNTPRLAPSPAAKPITALAYSSAPGHIVIPGDGAFTGLDLMSPHGELIPIPPGDLTAPSAPFRYLLKNSTHRVTFANLGLDVKTKINGDQTLPVAYSGNLRDLHTAWGIGNKAVPCDGVYISRPRAVGRFGEVELIDAGAEVTRRKLSTPGKVNDLSFSGDGSMLLAATGIAGLRGKAILWSVSDGQTVKSFSGHGDTLYAAQLSHANDLLATASYDGTIILWNVTSGEQLRTLTGHNGAVYDLKFSPDDRVLASASADATVKIWRVDTGQRLDTLSQPLKEQYSVDISPDGQFVVAGGEDNRIRLWRLLSVEKPLINPIIHASFAHEGAIQQVRFSSNGEYVVSAAADNTLKVWSTMSLQQLHAYPTQSDSPQAIALSRDNRLAVGRMDGSLDEYPLHISAPNNDTQAVTPVARAPELDLQQEEISESEPNDTATLAPSIRLPVTISGQINSSSNEPDVDLFRFSTRAGETWIVETNAARRGSGLDSHLAILQVDGHPVPRVQLQAVRDSYFTFRGKDSNSTGDFRLHNWEEMKLNQFLYCAGEVVRLFHYPRGPDSGFNVYPNHGNRRGYFDTTPLAHALHETCYIVEPHPPKAKLPPNGLPTFMVNFENDDQSQRRLGKDSRLTFVAPADGDYLVRLRDIRGLQGEDFTYELAIRRPKPDFRVKLLNSDLKVARNSGRKFGMEAERMDGYDGPISIIVKNLPQGFSVAGPLIMESGHDRAWATLWADADAKTPTAEEAAQVSLVALAKIGDTEVEHPIGSLGAIELDDKAVPLFVELTPDVESPQASGVPVIEIEPGSTTTATIRVQRNGYEGRINFGKEDSAVNSPHGVYVDNSGLNGVLIVEGQDERQFFLTAEPWVQPMERWIFVEASEAGSPTSAPVLLRVLPKQPSSDQQASG